MKGGDEMDLVVGAVYSIVILFYFIIFRQTFGQVVCSIVTLPQYSKI